MALQAQVAALEAQLKDARASLLRAIEKNSTLASVNMQHLSRCRAPTSCPDLSTLTTAPKCDGVQQHGSAASGVSFPNVDPHPKPSVVGFPAGTYYKPYFDQYLISSDRCEHNARLLFHCERASVQLTVFCIDCLGMTKLPGA